MWDPTRANLERHWVGGCSLPGVDKRELKIDGAATQQRDVNIYEQGKAFWYLITVILVFDYCDYCKDCFSNFQTVLFAETML